MPGFDPIFTLESEDVEKVLGHEAEGAIPNGHRFEKMVGEADDVHAPGARGIVLGSHHAAPSGFEPEIGYFVSWDDLPGQIGFVIGSKIKEVEDEPPAHPS